MTTERQFVPTLPFARERADAIGALTLYLVLLYAVPSSLRVVGLGSAGAPAMLFAITCLMWWGSEHIRARLPVLRDVWLMPALVVTFAVALALSYVNGMLHGGQHPLEGNTADMGLLRLLAWAGVFLVACDGITSTARLVRVLRRFVLAGALLSVLGLLQFTFNHPLIDWVSIPGLVADTSLAVVDRAGFTRPVATATHPLEFGVVATMTLPFAAVLALHDRNRGLVARYWPVIAVIAAISVSLSRSAMIGLVVCIVVLAAGWNFRTQLAVGFLGVVTLTGVYLLVPGMGTAILSLFGGIGTDESTVSRLDAVGAAVWVTGQNPILGRGLGTFVPQYYILDNQWLLLLVETGLAGAVAFLALLAGGVWCALRGRRRHSDALLRDIGQAFAAAIIGCALIMAFFDGLSFPMAAGTLFLVLGLTGAYVRLSGQTSRVTEARW